MLYDLKEIKSHPDKYLLTLDRKEVGHTEGVIDNVNKITDSKYTILIAFFHDIGKLNPNFQKKLLNDSEKVKEYSNHAYLSAFIFFVFFRCNRYNFQLLAKYLNDDLLCENALLSIIIQIAKHHGNLPDFSTPNNYKDTYFIVNKYECESLFQFVDRYVDNLPINEYIKSFPPFSSVEDATSLMKNKGMQIAFKNIRIKELEEPLEFYLHTQFSFSGLLIADKTEAARFDSLMEDNIVSVEKFGNIYSDKLNNYLSRLNSNTELNHLRTKIRKEAVANIEIGLKEENHIFELTAPTGSGKTLMLLSAASQIIKQKKEPFRILYILPFLSITEQVEKEINEIFKENKNFIRRIDSKAIDSEKFDTLQRKLDIGMDEDVMKEMDLLEFQSKTFSYPLVITTFVRFFETILSNRNSELLKLTNFSHAIFLIDEIQSLPPRLYGFFVAYIDKFCKMFNSYAVVSTATQPNYAFPSDKDKSKYEVFFKRDKEPFSILSLNYFSNHLFNRYSVNIDDKESISLEDLYEKIVSKECSVLIILNTIDDTKDLYKIFIEKGYSCGEVFLLNTHITPKDRNKKIEKVKEKLAEGERAILISTQLIEAGVNIDFPIVFRDFAIISSIVQSAGRCNRNGKLKEKGIVYVFKLKNRNKIRCNLIYSGEKDHDLLQFTKDILSEKNHYEENELLYLQQNFFGKIQEELLWGVSFINTEKSIAKVDLIDSIQKIQFEEVGKFQLIDENVFGKEYQFYIPDDENDTCFEKLIKYRNELFEQLKRKEDLDIIKNQKRKIKNHLMKMSNQIIQVRIKNKDNIPAKTELDDYYTLRKISNGYYTFKKGINLKGGDSII